MKKTPRALCALALLAAVVGIVLQILGGADYPVVPPGIIILVAAAAVVWFVPWRGAPVAGIVAALFLVLGLFAADQAGRLIEVDTVPDTVGLWIQMVSVLVALGAAVVAILRPRTSER
jgi:hypothetical protein